MVPSGRDPTARNPHDAVVVGDREVAIIDPGTAILPTWRRLRVVDAAIAGGGR